MALNDELTRLFCFNNIQKDISKNRSLEKCLILYQFINIKLFYPEGRNFDQTDMRFLEWLLILRFKIAYFFNLTHACSQCLWQLDLNPQTAKWLSNETNKTRQSVLSTKCCNAECHFFWVVLNKPFKLSVIMPNAVILSVVAPWQTFPS